MLVPLDQGTVHSATTHMAVLAEEPARVAEAAHVPVVLAPEPVTEPAPLEAEPAVAVVPEPELAEPRENPTRSASEELPAESRLHEPTPDDLQPERAVEVHLRTGVSTQDFAERNEVPVLLVSPQPAADTRRQG